MSLNSPLRNPHLRAYMKLLVIVVGFALLVVFQRDYVKHHTPPIEQPIGFLGIAEYYFRHPQRMIGFQ